MRRLAFILCLVSLLSEAPATAQLADNPPKALYQGESPYPFWVAADKVLTASGEVAPDLFSPADRYSIAGYMALPSKDGCIHLDDLVDINNTGGQAPDLEGKIHKSGWVLTAQVTSREAGFNGSIPGTLLQIVPKEIFKGPRHRLTPHYVFMPVGTVELGSAKFCKTDSRYPDLPEVGERILLLLDLAQINQDRFLWTGRETGILTLHDDGQVSLPAPYRKNAKRQGTSQAELLGFVRQQSEKEQ